jgi:DNA-binding LacI/PurR family transcriptional regulator/serine phosphatase RsbU (regulator of sigma subunit)
MAQPGKAANKAGRRRIALLVDTLNYAYQNELLLGVHEQCVQESLDLYCMLGGGILAAPNASFIYDRVGAEDFDGLVLSTGTLMHGESDAELLEFLRRFGETPVVSVARAVPNVASVIIDNVSSIREITKHLIDVHGRKRIATVRVNSREGEQRFEGYLAALSDCGITFDPALVVAGEFTWTSGVKAVHVLFDERKAVCDAIIGANDWIAMGALLTLTQRGIRVPEDVAVTGFDDVEDARFTNPPLTSIRQPVGELGIEAVRLLVELMHGKPVPSVNPVRTRLQFRQSCGCDLAKADRDSRKPECDAAEQGLSAPKINLEHWANALRQAFAKFNSRLADTWAQELSSALYGDLTGSSDVALLGNIAAVLGLVEQYDSVPDWHNVIQVLRAACIPSLRDNADQWFRAESLFERAHLLIAAAAERVQGQRRIERETALHLLNEMSREMRSLHEDEAVLHVLSMHLPRLQIPSFYVARDWDGGGPDGTSRLIQAHNSERDSSIIEGAQFRAGDLIPNESRPIRRHTMIVQTVNFGEGINGFCAAEMGPTIGLIYESIREMLNSGLQNASLLRIVVREVSKREQAERARLESEMKLAQRIQCEILPKAREVVGLEIATVMIPASEVGGDYFDILPFDGGCWLGIGDVAGHGLDTGLIMMMIQSIVAATTRSLTNVSPKEVWCVVNAVLFENIRQRLGRDEHATLSLLRYDKSGDILFAGAHEDLIIVRATDGRCETIPTRGVWAGICAKFGDSSLDLGHCRLGSGDLLVLYTDGITEAMNDRREVYGIERLCDALTRVADRSAEAIKDYVMAQVFNWSNVVSDDRTLIVARYTATTAI